MGLNFLFIILFALITDEHHVTGNLVHCEKFLENVLLQEKLTVVESNMKTLTGIWLSESCETRPGPQYILRYYSFFENGIYKLTQHHYWDNSCSSPKFTIISMGYVRIRRDSIFNHDAVSGYSAPFNITIIPQDTKAVHELEKITENQCPDQNYVSWSKYEEHLVYNDVSNTQPLKFLLNIQNQHRSNLQPRTNNNSLDLRCLGDLRWTFNELKLIKIQLRPNFNRTTEMRWELLLGDIPLDSTNLNHYTPTAFQVPLIKHTKSDVAVYKTRRYMIKSSCVICNNFARNEKVPPHLIKKPNLPAYVWGEWISERCEIKPSGLYLTRRFNFLNELTWKAEHKFYSDPSCSEIKFIVNSEGTYSTEGLNDILEDATNINFYIERVSLIVYDKYMLDYVQNGNCGQDIWKIGVPQEIYTNCYQLNIYVPSVRYDVIKVEINYQGFWILLLGEVESNNFSRSSQRPASFEKPLIRCSSGTNSENSIEPFYFKENLGCRQQICAALIWFYVLVVAQLVGFF